MTAQLRHRAATGLLASALLLSSINQSQSFDLFGIKLFGSDENAAELVLDPVTYAVTFDAGNDATADRLESFSLLVRDEEKPVSGALGLAIKAREERERLIAALYEDARYSGTVSIFVDGTAITALPPDPTFSTDTNVPIRVSVTPGQQFRFGNVELAGDTAGIDPVSVGLTSGDVAKATTIRSGTAQILTALKAQGRPLARIVDQQIIADHDTQTLDVSITLDAGPIAPVGNVSVSGAAAVDPDFIRNYSRLNNGQSYSPDELAAAAERLRELQVFDSVAIREAEALAADGSIPLEIEVSEGKHRYFGFGIQVATTDGLGIESYWGHRNLFGKAESLRIEGSINRIGDASRLEDLDFSGAILFAKPGAFGPATTFTADLTADYENPDAFRNRNIEIALGASREISKSDTARVGAELSWSDVTDAFGSNQYLLASVPLSYIRDTRDVKLNPKSGYLASITATPSYEFNNRTAFLGLEGELAGYKALGDDERLVLAARIKAGSLVGASSLSDIPANRRFFAGGGGSVRGFAFQEITPRDAAGKATGGRSFVSGSVEARVDVTEQIGVVPFLDFGTVSTNASPDFDDVRAGAGIGLRYATPFGPVRLDAAVPLNPYPGGSKYGIYAGIGQAF